MFYLCLTHGALIKEKDRIPFECGVIERSLGWTTDRRTQVVENASFNILGVANLSPRFPGEIRVRGGHRPSSHGSGRPRGGVSAWP